MLVLVSQKRSLKEGVFSTAGNPTAAAATQVESMHFGTNPAISTSGISQGFDDELAESQPEAEQEVIADRLKEKPIV